MNKLTFYRKEDGQAYICKIIYKDNNQVTYEEIPLHKWVNENNNGGTASYNIGTLEEFVVYAMEHNIPYFGLNLPNNT